MPPFHATRAIATTQARFFSRVATFIHEETPHAALREAALDDGLLQAIWAPRWAALCEVAERDAALFMCFLLACAVLRVDVVEAAAAIRVSAYPEMGMRLFLSERGLLRFPESELPALARIPGGRLSAVAVTMPAPSPRPRR